jgi:hypothetical protein
MWWIPLGPGVGLGDVDGLGEGLGLGLGVGDGLGVGLGDGVGDGCPAGGVGDAFGVGVGVGPPPLGGSVGVAVGVGCWINGLLVMDGKKIGFPSIGWTGLGAAAGRSSAGPPQDRTHAKAGMKANRKSLMLSPI